MMAKNTDSHLKITHLDDQGRPQMVNIADKTVTAREASAESLLRFPSDIAARLREQGMRGKKGGIIDTAIIAGIMAVKKTHELIPFCHPLPIDGCSFMLEWQDEKTLRIQCTVNTTHRTGVEMEALTGASVAALTVYDMSKALSHKIVIQSTRLLAKKGGKRDITSTRTTKASQ